ncbi:MAG TPA: anaerobic C4-dicarboxylate transporter [Candidatus Mucispirillum faecigallinarum]|uniref:Anaerobic C4-dicarboxylate transporter n=1 Tax=Candidatus Mucispirillum faecigallinarum TaxID=2838699 RepID=A0A9D2GVG1_9BACT|nr:anaerobic C4-dicarboxylate transporter [Candidatus Mucispirillum faecigallinarum]
MIIVQLLIVLLALYVGSRYGSIALGVISGIGLAILVFAFGLKPGTPPTDVIYIIIAAVTCAGVLQASGGMDFMIQIAEKFLRSHPERITFFAPLCTFFLTVLVGTGHVVYTLMPIIADISLKKGIRPERPCAVASVASQVGITCSPIAAAVVAFVTITNEKVPEVGLTIPQILMITIPACLCGIMAAAFYSSKRGLDLDKDPKYQERLKDPELREYMFGSTATTLDKKIPATAKASVYMFLAALAIIVILASFEQLLPHYDGKPLKMNLVIQIVMLTVAGLMILLCKAEPKKVVSGSVWQAGMVAVVAIYGIAWLSDTYFVAYKGEMMTAMKDIVNAYPWAIAFVLFAVSVLINTQGGVVLAIMPLAYDLGIPWYVLLGVLPSVYGYFFIPNYPSDIATVNFDRSGTTVIGKYLLNHSFMAPGLISVIVSTIIGYLLANIVY